MSRPRPRPHDRKSDEPPEPTARSSVATSRWAQASRGTGGHAAPGDEAGNCGCLHSEENAVINCDAPRTVEKLVFVTHLPCVACAKRLINLGNVKAVYYQNDYRLRDSIDILRSVGIEVGQLEG